MRVETAGVQRPWALNGTKKPSMKSFAKRISVLYTAALASGVAESQVRARSRIWRRERFSVAVVVLVFSREGGGKSPCRMMRTRLL